MVLKSGPAGTTYPEEMSKEKLADALLKYRTVNPATVFAEREASRYMRKMGLDAVLREMAKVATATSDGKVFMA